MRQRSRIIILLMLLATAFLLHKLLIGTWIPYGANKSYWFTGGLLLLIICMFLLEPFFTSPKDAIVNSIVVIVSLLSIGDQAGFVLWKAALGYSFFIFLNAVVAAYINEKFFKHKWQRAISRIAYDISRTLGKGKVIFSVIFILSIFSFFSTQSKSFLILLLFWGSIIIIEPIGLSNLVAVLFEPKKCRDIVPMGIPRMVSYPNYLIVELIARKSVEINDLCMRKIEPGIFRVYKVIEKINFVSAYFAKIVYVGQYAFEEQVSKKDMHILNKKCDEQFFYLYDTAKQLFDVSGNIFLEEQSEVAAIVQDNSNISRICGELVDSNIDIEEGALLKTHIRGKRVFYQLVNGETASYMIENAGIKAYIKLVAQQIGEWDETSKTFSSMGWVPEIGVPVYAEERHENFNMEECKEIEGRYIVGTIPNSNFPIHVDLDNIVTHHTAILGVTGSGKSCLAYNLIEELGRTDVKVICFDISGDYKKHLRSSMKEINPVPGEFDSFLNGAEKIAVVDMTNINQNSTLPAATSKAIGHIFNWVKRHLPSQLGEKVKARICIVFEEAHSLIPEWNTCSVASDRDRVNETSRLILQGRKYGLGCIVVTQRTANVTKTILNQCNTIFALQSFDKTGIEFLTNYMGEGYADALSVLKFRHCVLFGKASSSKRPIIVEMRERDFSHINSEDDSPEEDQAQQTQ